MINDEVEYVFKIVAVGMGGVGKTSLIRRFASGKFEANYLMTLGVDFTTKSLKVSDTNIKIVCADTAGQVYYERVRPQFYEGANAAFVVFDLTNRNSFESVERWITELQQYLKGVPIAIVGNKLDLTLESDSARRISENEGSKFCSDKGMKYFETSAKTSKNVDLVFSHLAEEIMNRST